MHRLWLIFTQTVTVSLAVFFVISTLRPEWLAESPGRETQVVALHESSGSSGEAVTSLSYRDAARRALPSVVHVFTSQKIRQPRHPLIDDPLFRYFFGGRPESSQRTSGLGSGVIVSSQGNILTNYHFFQLTVIFESIGGNFSYFVGGTFYFYCSWNDDTGFYFISNKGNCLAGRTAACNFVYVSSFFICNFCSN